MSNKYYYYIIFILNIPLFFGGQLASISIFILSIFSFIYFITTPKINLFLLFLLLLPNILFESLEIYPDEDNVFLTHFTNAISLGPISVSSKFFMALAVPIRLIFEVIKTNKTSTLLLLYFIVCLVSFLTLFIAYFSGVENSSGLTLGFRSVLIFGVILLPNIFDHQFYLSVNRIFLLSLFFLATGFANGHWMFIVYGFLSYLTINLKPKLSRVLIFFLSFVLLSNLSNTLTIILLTLFSIIIFFTLRIFVFLLKKKYLFLLILLLPLLITVFVISIESNGYYDFNSLLGFARFKLLGDRKPIWDASWEFIVRSNYFFNLPGSQLTVYFDFRRQYVDWPMGSHNIFLELARNISVFGFFIVYYFMILLFMQTRKYIFKKSDVFIFFSFYNIFFIYGLTGNSLIYDGVGFMFWILLVSYKYQLIYDKNK